MHGQTQENEFAILKLIVEPLDLTIQIAADRGAGGKKETDNVGTAGELFGAESLARLIRQFKLGYAREVLPRNVAKDATVGVRIQDDDVVL